MTPSSPTSQKSPTAAPVESKWRQVARRVGLVLLGALILFAVAFAMLPVWISNEQGRAYVLDRINRRLNGPRLAIDGWSIGWFRATDVRNLRIAGPDGAILVSCPHVVSGLSLWGMVTGNYDLGSTTADALELTVTKNADGSTSMDALAKNGAGIVRSVRGAIRINNAQVSLASAKSGQSLLLTGFQATVTIASSDAPFHVQVYGRAMPGWGAGASAPAAAGPEGEMSLNATFPSIRALVDVGRDLTAGGGWLEAAGGAGGTILDDVDFAASRVPSELACDFLGVDGGWAQSFGRVLESVQFSSHGNPTAVPPANHVSLLVRGAADGGGSAPVIDARVMLLPPEDEADGAAGGTITIPGGGGAGSDFHLEAALRLSPPLMRTLARVNPLLGEAVPAAVAARGIGGAGGTDIITSGGEGGLLHIGFATLTVPVGAPDAAEANFRVTFPPLAFAPRADGPSLVRQFQVITGELVPPAATRGAGRSMPAASRVEGSVGLLRAHLEEGQFSYENFLVQVGRSRLNFSGSVALDGNVDLLAVIPGSGTGLSVRSSQVLVTGTVEMPVVQRAD